MARLVRARPELAGTRWGLPTLGLVAVAIAAVFGRWRHLVVFLISLAALNRRPLLYKLAARPRPYSITAIADWEGFSSPSRPVAALTAVLVGMVYMEVVAGRPRWYAKLATAAVLVAVGLLRTYLGIEHRPTTSSGSSSESRSRSRCSARSSPTRPSP